MSNLEASIRESLRKPLNKMHQVHSFEQQQLINMKRYRSIQWYQVTKALKALQQLNNNNNNNNTATNGITTSSKINTKSENNDYRHSNNSNYTNDENYNINSKNKTISS